MFNHYHAKEGFKKKAATMLLLVLGIMLMILSSTSKQVKAYDTTSMVTVSTEAPLYRTPDAGAEVIGTYYQGVFVFGDPVDNGWFHAIFPDNVSEIRPNFSGYMRMEDLLPYDVMMERKDMPYFHPVGEALEEADLIETVDGAEVIARVPKGTVLEILGEQSDWIHVRAGEIFGFLQRAHVMYAEETAHVYNGPPPRGYIVPDWGDGWQDEAMQIHTFPDVNIGEDRWAYGRSLAVFAQIDDWLQIRERVAGRTNGFLHNITGNIYWLKDMKGTEGIRLGQGEYTVGRDLPPGLYTFSSPAGGMGSIEVTGESQLLYHAYDSTGAPYTMYLADGVSVSIRGDGMLSPMDEQNALTAENGWTSTAGGRFLFGENLIHPQGKNEVCIRLLPDEKIGYYALSTLDDETGVGERPKRYKLLPEDDEIEIYLEPGMFLEIKNCAFRFEFGNG